MVAILYPLKLDKRVLRTLQCPEHIQPNAERTGYRVSSGAFIPGSDDTVSVDLEESLEKAGLIVTSIYPHLPRSVALVSHMVGTYVAQNFIVKHDPVPNNDHHGSVSTALKNKALRRSAREMAENADFVVPIDPVHAVRLGAAAL